MPRADNLLVTTLRSGGPQIQRRPLSCFHHFSAAMLLVSGGR